MGFIADGRHFSPLAEWKCCHLKVGQPNHPKLFMQNHSKNLVPELESYAESGGTRLAIIKHLDVTRTPAMKLLNTNVSEWNDRKLRAAAIVSSVVTLAWWIGLTFVAQRPIWFW